MMKAFNLKFGFVVLLALISSLAAGCKGHSNPAVDPNAIPPNKGALSFNITAGSDSFSYSTIKSANITISKMDVLTSTGSTTVLSTPQTIDLMSYTNGFQKLLVKSFLSPASYDHVQIFISAASLDLYSGTHINLSVPSTASAGMSIAINPAVYMNVQTNETILIQLSISNTFQAVLDSLGNITGWNFVPSPIAVDPKKTAAISGYVYSNMGTPSTSTDDRMVRSAAIQIKQAGTLIASAVTRSDGSYKVIGLVPGNYDISATGAGYTGASTNNVFSAAGTEQNINFTLGLVSGALWGQIKSGGYSVGGSQVVLSKLGVLVSTVYADSNGYYYFDNLLAGNYNINVTTRGYFNASVTGDAVITGIATQQNFILTLNTGSIVGNVTDVTTGYSISGATVSFYLGSSWIADATTGYDGHYSMAMLDPGNYSLVISKYGYVTAYTYNDFVSAATVTQQNVLLTLNTGAIAGVVRDYNSGNRISGARITFSQSGWEVASLYTSYDGSYSINLDPGYYDVAVTASGYGNDTAYTSVSGGYTSTDNFSLVRNTGSLSGRVTDYVTGFPISGAYIKVKQFGFTVATATSDYDGYYSIYDLDVGTYDINVSEFSYSDVNFSNEHIYAGTTTNQDVNM